MLFPKLVIAWSCLSLLGCDRPEKPAPRKQVASDLETTRRSADPQPLTSVPLPTYQADGDRLFQQLSPQHTGIRFVAPWTPARKDEEELGNAFAGGGVAIGDYDGDGLPDVFLTGPQSGGRLYRNLGGMCFQDVTQQSGVAAADLWSAGTTFVDIDDDGDLDLFVCGFVCPNRLYINRGDGTFEQLAQEFGLGFRGASVMMAFADYDADGDLDAYLLTNRLPAKPGRYAAFDSVAGVPRVREEFRDYLDVLELPDGSHRVVRTGQRDYLFRNNGDLTFSDVSEQSGIDGHYFGLSATWWDHDGDGRTDLYVSNDFWGPDQLYHNNGDGTFTDVIARSVPHTPWFSMGADAADINNDGRLDLLATDMASRSHYQEKVSMGDMNDDGWFLDTGMPRQYMRNALYLNTGTQRFMEIAHMTGLATTEWTWSVNFGDLDNDGWVDLFVSNGMTRDWFNSDLRADVARRGGWNNGGRAIWHAAGKRADANLMFRNLGTLQFEDVSRAWGLDQQSVSFGSALGDLDGDGDLDLVINNFEQPASVYRNDCARARRVKIRLRGTTSNQYGIGSTVRIHTSRGQQVRFVTLSRGFMSASDPVVHFGLGSEKKIDRLIVKWPSGIEQSFDDLDADCFYTVVEPLVRPGETRAPPLHPKSPMFVNSTVMDVVTPHKERPFNDFARQPLLPNRHSQLGPGMAWGDVDANGTPDLFIGGAMGDVGRLYLNHGNGEFFPGKHRVFDTDAASEDMGCLFFDADSDGDQDLYVVSGGVECQPGDDVLRDRLYLNNGRGDFHKAPSAMLPDVRDSGGTVVAADFDRDGDLDLFVGGRVVPGQYPVTANSRLLRNEEGVFSDATDALAPGLRRSGLVTSALWSDADRDGWVDLFVTHEWGPIKYYRNESGRFVDRTRQAGLAQLTGWWNAVAGRDLDGDGDVDYVATNFGLNTKYHASPAHPAVLYYGDFDQTGRRRIVEATQRDDRLLPLRGKSCSQNAMPFIVEEFPRFHDFAVADLADIYGADRLQEAIRLEANILDSGILRNNGRGKFAFEPLPRLAQASPGFGVAVTEVDGDGYSDVFVVQNFFGAQRETGRMDGGIGLLLLGDGSGGLTPVPPDRSGLVVDGDATSLTTLDLNGDQRPDFFVGVNNDRPRAFLQTESSRGKIVEVRLEGLRGNPTAVGARVTLRIDGATSQTAEVYAGSGYLSQSPGSLYFGTAGREVDSIDVRWPDGRQSTYAWKRGETRIVLQHPDLVKNSSSAVASVP